MSFFSQRQRGMTLAETLIGFVIVGILLALGAPSFSLWIQSVHIRSAAEAMQAGLQLARAEAVHRNTNVNFVLNGTTAGWTVSCAVAANCSDIAATVAGTIQTRPATEGSSRAVVATTETGAAAAGPFAATGSLTFNGMGMVNATSLGAGNEARFDISNPAGGACKTPTGSEPMRCLRLVVKSGGQVRMCDPGVIFNVHAAPQGC